MYISSMTIKIVVIHVKMGVSICLNYSYVHRSNNAKYAPGVHWNLTSQ